MLSRCSFGSGSLRLAGTEMKRGLPHIYGKIRLINNLILNVVVRGGKLVFWASLKEKPNKATTSASQHPTDDG